MWVDIVKGGEDVCSFNDNGVLGGGFSGDNDYPLRNTASLFLLGGLPVGAVSTLASVDGAPDSRTVEK